MPRFRETTERPELLDKVRTAVLNGSLDKPAKCEECGCAGGDDRGTSLQAHHPHYGKPLDVEFLCPTCHRSKRRVEKKKEDRVGVRDSFNEAIFQEKDYSTSQRRKLASSKKAMPDGSFPIVTRKDLANAVKAFSRSSNPVATKRFIRKRARALRATKLLPPSFQYRIKESADALNGYEDEKSKLLHHVAHHPIPPQRLTTWKKNFMKKGHEGERAGREMFSQQFNGWLHTDEGKVWNRMQAEKWNQEEGFNESKQRKLGLLAAALLVANAGVLHKAMKIRKRTKVLEKNIGRVKSGTFNFRSTGHRDLNPEEAYRVKSPNVHSRNSFEESGEASRKDSMSTAAKAGIAGAGIGAGAAGTHALIKHLTKPPKSNLGRNIALGATAVGLSGLYAKGLHKVYKFVKKRNSQLDDLEKKARNIYGSGHKTTQPGVETGKFVDGKFVADSFNEAYNRAYIETIQEGVMGRAAKRAAIATTLLATASLANKTHKAVKRAGGYRHVVGRIKHSARAGYENLSDNDIANLSSQFSQRSRQIRKAGGKVRSDPEIIHIARKIKARADYLNQKRNLG